MCVNGFPRASRSNFFEATPPRHLTAHASPVRTLLTPCALNHIHCDIVDLLRLPAGPVTCVFYVLHYVLKASRRSNWIGSRPPITGGFTIDFLGLDDRLFGLI